MQAVNKLPKAPAKLCRAEERRRGLRTRVCPGAAPIPSGGSLTWRATSRWRGPLAKAAARALSWRRAAGFRRLAALRRERALTRRAGCDLQLLFNGAVGGAN